MSGRKGIHGKTANQLHRYHEYHEAEAMAYSPVAPGLFSLPIMIITTRLVVIKNLSKGAVNQSYENRRIH
jgi:hypothetical protein